MSRSWNFRAFSEGEHRRRLEAARERMAAAGLDACVCGSFLMTPHGPERLDEAPIELVIVER